MQKMMGLHQGFQVSELSLKLTNHGSSVLLMIEHVDTSSLSVFVKAQYDNVWLHD